MRISILIATIGKESLLNMLDSLKNQLTKDDFIYVIVDGLEYHERTKEILSRFNGYVCKLIIIYENDNLGYWGHGIRNKYQKQLDGDYILHADDDDIYMENSMSIIRKNIKDFNKMYLFKFYHDFSKGISFWRVPEIKLNNIGTPCGSIPNIPDKMGTWGYKYGGDFDFYNSCEFDYEFVDDYIYMVNKNNKR